MGDRIEERQVFESFIRAAPLFAGATIARWSQATDEPADIECELIDGRKIGVQLTSWLDESQIGRAKIKEFLQQSVRDAIKPEPPNETEHIWFVRIFPKRQVPQKERAAFRQELVQLVEEINRDPRWDTEPVWRTPQGFPWNDFGPYPVLRKHLRPLDILPRIPSSPDTMKKGGQHWLTLWPRAGPYSPYWPVDALCRCIQAKTAKYNARPTGVDEFHLLVHYDKAWAYDTPVLGIDFGFAEAIQAAAACIGGSTGVFDRIIVFVPFADGQQVFSLSPQ